MMDRDELATKAHMAAWDAQVTLQLTLQASQQVAADRLMDIMAVVRTEEFWHRVIGTVEIETLDADDAAIEIIRAGWLPGVTVGE
jgi:hypothetical protein